MNSQETTAPPFPTTPWPKSDPPPPVEPPPPYAPSAPITTQPTPNQNIPQAFGAFNSGFTFTTPAAGASNALFKFRSVEIFTSSCSFDFEIRSVDNSSDVLQVKRIGNRLCSSFELWHNGEHIVSTTMSGENCSSLYNMRSVQCPPGTELFVSRVKKEGYGRYSPVSYRAYVKDHYGRANIFLRKIINACGGMGVVMDYARRDLGFIEGSPCGTCCGGRFKLTFNPNSTVIDRLVMLDFGIRLTEQSWSYPKIWLVLAISFGVSLVITGIVLGIVIGSTT